MRSALLAAALILVGCDQLDPYCITGSAAPPTGAEASGLTISGVERTLVIRAPVIDQCFRRDAPDVRLTSVELFDAKNTPVAVTATEPELEPDTRVWSARLTFTPTVAGPMHLVAVFEPEHGLVQLDIWVVEDHRADLPQVMRTPGETCKHVAVTSVGGVVCETQNWETVFFRAGVPLMRWTWDTTVSVVGDVVWIHRWNAELLRTLDTGTGLLEAAGRVDSNISRGPFAAQRDRIAFATQDGVRVFRVSGGQLAVESQVKLGANLYPHGIAFDGPTETLMFASQYRWSRLTIAPGNSELEAQWTAEQEMTYRADDGVWALNAPSKVGFVPASPTRTRVDFETPQGWEASLVAGERPVFTPWTGSGAATPPPATEAAVPYFKGDDVQLALFSAPPGAAFVEYSGGSVRAVAGDTHYFFPLADLP